MLLLPAGDVDVSGFGIEAAYLPISEVGGDFYWTRAEAGGALLVVAGDVSGKGLKAAMLVSVTIGILRSNAPRRQVQSNAGHPSPYCDGERFTFVSEGVVEAENTQRELFGFDRTRKIRGTFAHEIAEAAKAWGQYDDITEVTVRRKA